jgi:hypothetical protein
VPHPFIPRNANRTGLDTAELIIVVATDFLAAAYGSASEQARSYFRHGINVNTPIGELFL